MVTCNHSTVVLRVLAIVMVLLAPSILRSQADENTWVWQQVDERRAQEFVFSPDFSEDRTLFAGVANGDRLAYGMLKSTDAGVSWEQMPGMSEVMGVRRLAISPAFADDQTLFAAITRRIYSAQEGAQSVLKSVDGGMSWLPAQQGITLTVPNLLVNAVAVSPSYPQDSMVLVGMQTLGLFRTMDGGTSWQNIWQGDGTTSVSVIRFSPTFASDRTLFLGTLGSGIWKSLDGGETWSNVGQDLSNSYLRSAAISPSFAQDQTIFFAGDGGTVHRSVDGGQSWQLVTEGIESGASIWSLVLSPQYVENKTLYAGDARGNVYKSEDNGDTWQDLQTPSLAAIEALAVIPGEMGETLLAASTGEGIWKYSVIVANSSEAAAATAEAQAKATSEASTAKVYVFATPVPERPGPRNWCIAPVVFPLLPLLGLVMMSGSQKRRHE